MINQELSDAIVSFLGVAEVAIIIYLVVGVVGLLLTVILGASRR